jgi:hypothetical protein
MPVLKFEFWTAGAPADAGTDLPLYFSAYFNAGPNLAQGRTGDTSLNSHAMFEFPISGATAVTSAAVRLNGLAPDATDNWKPNRVKLTFGDDVLVDSPWDLPFDHDHRSHEIYRLAFDSLRGGDGERKRSK